MKHLLTILLAVVFSHCANALTAITGTLSVCQGTSTVLTDGTPGGAWASSNSAVATIGSSGILSGVSAGTSTITYTVIGSYVTAIVTVKSLNAGIISGTPSDGVGSTDYLSDNVPGGTWTSSDTTVATIGSTSGIVFGFTTGTATIKYTVDGCTGPVDTTMVMTIVGAGCGPIGGGPVTICAGTTLYLTLTDSASIGVSDTTVYGGTWKSSNPAVAYIDSADALVKGLSSGDAIITYTFDTIYYTTLITVADTPTGISGAADLCIGATISLSDAISGGTWSCDSFSSAEVGALSGVVTGVTAGSSTITYTLPDGCASYATVTTDPCIAGIAPMSKSTSFVSIFPNPANSILNIQWQEATSENSTVTLSDVVGHIVYTSSINMSQSNGSAAIDVATVAEGIYTVCIKNGSLRYTDKINIRR